MEFTSAEKVFFMKEALKEAIKGYKKGEVPIGALLVFNETKKIISCAYNRRIKDKDSTAHAEILAIKKACKKMKDFRLSGCSLFVTLAPCPMCSGAIVNSRIENVYWGADSDRSDTELISSILNSKTLNHKVMFEGGILSDECSNIVKKFFKEKRDGTRT